MKNVCLSCFLALIFCFDTAPFLDAAQQRAATREPAEKVASSTFEPLDRWKEAVIAGNKSALSDLYMKTPPALAKTPEGQTQAPAEEPAYWSLLRTGGLRHFDVKVLEEKNLQPGVKGFVLRYELKFQTPSGEKSAVISGSQVWMQKLGEWRIVTTQRGAMVQEAARRLPEPAKPNTQLYPDPEEAPTEIAAALSAAAKDHKRVILVFGGNWCYDCHVLDATFRSRQIAPLVNDNFHVVHVNVGEYDKNLDLTRNMKFPWKRVSPAWPFSILTGSWSSARKRGNSNPPCASVLRTSSNS